MDYETKDQIRRACGYISDDAYLASHYGVRKKQVASIRTSVSKTAKMHVVRAGKSLVGDPLGQSSDEIERKSACRRGSERLLDAMMWHFSSRARTERCDVWTAGSAILDGYDGDMRELNKILNARHRERITHAG